MTPFADQWKNTDINATNNNSEPPEPGTYEVALQDARAFTAKSGGEWFVCELTIVTGPLTGHTWSVLANLAKDGGVAAAKSMSMKLGVPIDTVDSLEDLDTMLKVHVGSYYEVDVVQKGEWRNTFIQRALTGDVPESDVPSDVPVAAHAGAAAEGDDLEIPFMYSAI